MTTDVRRALEWLAFATACATAPWACGRSTSKSTDEATRANSAVEPKEASVDTPDAISDADNSYLPPEDPIDLDASLAHAVSAAASALPTKPPPPEVVDSFVLVNADAGAYYRAAASLARKLVTAVYAGPFRKHPSEAVTVFVFSTQPAFDRFCATHPHISCTKDAGEYNRVTQTIAMLATPGGETIAHEMSHAITREDFPRIPKWLYEGIGTLYENPYFCGPERVTGIKNWRYDRLRSALDSPAEHPTTRIDLLFPMDARTFTAEPPDGGAPNLDREQLHYATARFFVQWLDRRGWLWPFYHAFRDGIATDRTGEKAFAAVVGKTPAEANDDWEKYVRGLAAPNADNPCPP